MRKTRIFKIEPFHRKVISKHMLLKILSFIDKKSRPTPYLLLDKEVIREKASIIGKNIRNSRVFYAVKANPEPALIKYIHSLGLGFEIASEGELALLKSIKVSPDKIITSNPVKSFKFLRMASSYGVKYYAFDSVDEVDKLARYVSGASVYVRLSVPNEGSEWPLSRKFGVELEDALSLILYAKKKGLKPCGLTFHVGSQCTNIYNWSTALLKAHALWNMAKEKGIEFEMINIGGGYPIRYTKDVVNIEPIEKSVDKLIAERFPKGVSVFIEPGRALVGDAGVFVTTVIGKAERVGENWLYLDVGVFNGLMESLGGIRYSYMVEEGGRRKIWTITGPSCDSFDVIDRDVILYEPKIGSIVLILSSGAYTISYASEFNGFSIPKTILI